MCRESVDTFLVVADLPGPKILDLLGMFSRFQQTPAIDAHLTVGERDRGQLHAHTVEAGNKGFNVKVRHLRSPLKRCETFYAVRSYALDFTLPDPSASRVEFNNICEKALRHKYSAPIHN